MSGGFCARAVVFNHLLRYEGEIKKRQRALEKWLRSRVNKSQLPSLKLGSWDFCFQRSVGERIGPHLELHELGSGSFAALHVKWRSRGDRRVEALPFPAAVGIIDAAV
jgi:hypothetical protein